MLAFIVCVFGSVLLNFVNTISDFSPDGRITGGHVASSNQFPYMAFLLISYWSDEEELKMRRCAGSIISNVYILTAAHCIEKFGEKMRFKIKMTYTFF